MKITTLIYTIAALLMAVAAHAEHVNYKFSGEIYSLSIFDGQTTSLVSAGGFLGNTFKIGDTLNGDLVLDAGALLDQDYIGLPRIASYVDAVQRLNFSAPNSGILGGNLSAENLTIMTDRFGKDYLDIFTANTRSLENSEYIELNLLDPTGAAFTTFDIPTPISLAPFQYKILTYNWVDLDTNNAFSLSANLKTLELIPPVPEPDSRLLLVIGLLAVGFLASRRKSIINQRGGLVGSAA